MHTHTRTMKLIPLPPLTDEQSETLARRVAATRKRRGIGRDAAIPDTVPVGATVVHGPARRGRPRLTPEGTQTVTLRIPKRVLQFYKQGGRGWQTRAIATLTQAVEAGRNTTTRNHPVRRSRIRPVV